MSYKLEKPYTDKQRADFVCEHQGLNYYEDDDCIIMYLDSESVTNGVVTDISDTDEYKAKVKKQEIQAAKAIRDEAIDKITNSILIDQLLIKELDLKLAATTITQAEYDTAKAIYDARIVAKATQYVVAKETFYTTTGLIEPTTITV